MKRISKFAAVLIFCLGIEVSAAQPNGDAPTTGDSARKETEKPQQCGQREILCSDKESQWCCPKEYPVCGRNEEGFTCRPPSAKRPLK